MATIKVSTSFGTVIVKPCSLVDIRDVVNEPETPLPGPIEPSDDIFPE